MRKITYILFLLSFLFIASSEADAMERKKKKDKKGETPENAGPSTPYDKLFKDKKVNTARGLMTLHRVDNKIYVSSRSGYWIKICFTLP